MAGRCEHIPAQGLSLFYREILVTYRLLPLLLVLFCTSALLAGEISADRIKSAVAHLASDRLEGRDPGTNGEVLTVEYLVDEFVKMGLKPIGEKQSYFQPVPLGRVVTSSKSTLLAVQNGKIGRAHV